MRCKTKKIIIKGKTTKPQTEYYVINLNGFVFDRRRLVSTHTSVI